MRRVAAIAVAVALSTVTLAGCSFGSDPEGTYVPTSGEVAFYPQAAEGLGDEAAGTLALVGGCLTLETADAGTLVPVFGGADATWDGDKLTFGGKTYAAGDRMTLTGGLVAEDYLGPMTYMPAGCDKSAAFFVAPTPR